jgi:gas vesicle protein
MSKVFKLALAAVGGFAAGILLAPKSGKETRADLKAKADEAKAKANTQKQKLKNVGAEGSVTFKKGADSASKEAVAFGRSAKATAERIAAEAVELGGEARTRARRVAADAKTTAETIKKDAEKGLKDS